MSSSSSEADEQSSRVRRWLQGILVALFCMFIVSSIREAEWPADMSASFEWFGGGDLIVASHEDHSHSSDDEGESRSNDSPGDQDDPGNSTPGTGEGEGSDDQETLLASQGSGEDEEGSQEENPEGGESDALENDRIAAIELPLRDMPALPSLATDAPDEDRLQSSAQERARGDRVDRLLVWSLSGNGPDSYPRLVGVAGSEVEYNDYFAATDPESQRTNWLTNVHLEQILALSRNFRIDSRARVVLNSDGEDRRFYSDFPHEGLYLTRLKAEYTSKHLSFFAGKYEPARQIRGYGAIFFGNYTRDLELDGRLGGGAALTLGNEKTGQHTLSGHLFRIDSSRLRGEIFSDRWREDEQLAEAGPIGFPKSYLLTLNGKTLGSEIELGYTLGAGEQRRGTLPVERIKLGALYGKLPLSAHADLQLSVDAMTLDGAGGYAEDSEVIGPSAGISTRSYFLGATYTLRRVFDRDARMDRVDHIGELVGRYALSRRTTVEAAYQHVLERGEHENALGIVLQYAADWMVH